LSASAQDYLEAIFQAAAGRGVTRVSVIAERMQVKKPSVVAAVRSLAGKGLVRYERYGFVELTGAGRAAAKQVLSRHQGLQRFLSGFLGVDPETAETDACRMEHALSPRTMKRLLKFLDFVGEASSGERPCRKAFQRYVATGRRQPCAVESR
jgi:DtxR family Mn-dependent transcriptional regulator